MKLKRKKIIESSMASLGLVSALSAAETKEQGNFFKLEKRQGRWIFIDPAGKPFFSMGLNHIDPASLRYPENLDLWKEKYQGSTINWIENSVRPNLKKWGFNTVGWVQEVTVRQWQHSRAFTIDEYRALDMPYCHLLPFIESHQWEKHTRHYDFRSSDWKEWCDYVARSHCAEMKDERNLIGYFYSDCPCWVHERPFNKWKGPMFDPDRLKSKAGQRDLFELASSYYKTTNEAIHRYDPNHLILGDRYEANASLPMEVVDAALPYIDVLSFQDFVKPVEHLQYWYELRGKPVLLADAAGLKTPVQSFFKENNGTWYANTLSELFKNKGCVGFHLCGAYQRNKARRRGLLDERENPDHENVVLIRKANHELNQKMKQMFSLKETSL